MNMPRKQVEVTINYPQRPGYIMKSHALQQELECKFGLSARLVEDTGPDFTVVVNGSIIYTHASGENSSIDHLKIFRIIGRYAKPLALTHTPTLPPEDYDDPDHIQWMNSFCSGE